MLFYNNITVAIPRKLTKPTISVIVVKMTVLPIAGSILNLLSMRGTAAPKKPAANRLTTIESAITTPSIHVSNQIEAITPMSNEKIIPLPAAISNSFLMVRFASFLAMSPCSLPLSSIAELLTAKIRTLKMYEEKGLLPHKGESKKLYSIDDVKLIAFTHYLASVKKINANGIKYILEMLHNNMDEKNRDKFIDLVEKKMEKLSGIDIKDVEVM